MRQSLPVGKYNSSKIPTNGQEFLGFVRHQAAQINSTSGITADCEINTENNTDPPYPLPKILLPHSCWKRKLTSKIHKTRQFLNSKRSPSKHSIKNMDDLILQEISIRNITMLSRTETLNILKRLPDWLQSLCNQSIDSRNNLIKLLKWAFYLLVYSDRLVLADEMHDLRRLAKIVRKLRAEYYSKMRTEYYSKIASQDELYDLKPDDGQKVNDTALDVDVKLSDDDKTVLKAMGIVVFVVATDFGQRDLEDPSRPEPSNDL
jgi:hypothetical protein